MQGDRLLVCHAHRQQHPLAAALLFNVAACASTHWQRPGTPDANKDVAECRTEGHQQAIEQLPYGNGPPLYGFSSEVSMLHWKMAIDNERAYLEEDLAAACMRHRGFVLVPAEVVQ
jgi:hypothetical protein